MTTVAAPRPSLVTIVARSLVIYSLLVSLLFLAGIVWLYRERLREQRADAAARVNLLLQVSLENAMLKRDIPGLMEIVERLGRHEGIDAVMILNSQGEVRFASRSDLLHRKFDLAGGGLCADCRWDGRAPLERQDMLPAGIGHEKPVLRSAKSVSNRQACQQCHGDPAVNPVNGILVVDHHAGDIRWNALSGALTLAGSGMLVVLGLVLGIYRTLKRSVLDPVAQLTEASGLVAAGDLTRRVEPTGGQEVAALGSSFNSMAQRLQGSIDALRDRERFVQALLDAIPDGVRVIGPDFRIVLANRAYRRMLGEMKGGLIGAFCYRSAHGREEPCVPTLVKCPLVELKEDGAHIKFHTSYRRSDGREMLVEVVAVRVIVATPEGLRSLIIESIRDLDAQIQVSHEQRLSELGQLATGVAHEIRNPLSSIDMLLSDAIAQAARDDCVPLDASLHLIRHEVERCLGITDSLLKLGTLPDGERQLIFLNDIVSDIFRLVTSQAQDAGIHVVIAIEEGLRLLGADSDLRIVMINLMQNAFHAMPSGGTLTIDGRWIGDGMLSLAFSDTGFGIPKEDLANIFLPFWSRRADGVHGTGLGLSICHSILRGLGGTISVVSEVGKGTTFTLTLPDADLHVEPAHAG